MDEGIGFVVVSRLSDRDLSKKGIRNVDLCQVTAIVACGYPDEATWHWIILSNHYHTAPFHF
jgi:hypothetical protein